jgi:copper resistance protein C
MKRMFHSGGGRIARLAVVAVLLSVGLPRWTQAQPSLVRASPAADTTVKAPLDIELWFNEPVQNRSNAVAVLLPVEASREATSQPQSNLARGMPMVDPRDPRHLSVVVEPLPWGTYVVEWQVFGRDGRMARGQFNFEVLRTPY